MSETIKENGKKDGQIKLIILSLAMCAIAFFVLISIEKNMLAGYEKGRAVVVAKEIPARTLITEKNADQYFKVVEMEKTIIPDAGFESLEEVYGYMPEIRLEKGVIPTPAMLTTPEGEIQTMKNPVMAGFSADDLYQVVGGVLRAGDRIHIYSVNRESGNADLVWSDVPVVQVFDSSGEEILGSDEKTAAQRVNIYIEQDNVATLYTELAAGSLRVVKVCD